MNVENVSNFVTAFSVTQVFVAVSAKRETSGDCVFSVTQDFVAVFSGGEPSEDCVRQRLSSGLRAVQQTLAGGDHKAGSLSSLPASSCPHPHRPHP